MAEASLDEALSRWVWLIKRLLAFPHCVILTFLWIAYRIVGIGAYVSLMTDPPFRLDMGGPDLGGSPAAPSTVSPGSVSPRQAGWMPGRTASVVVGPVLALTSVGLLTGGGALLWADSTQRDADGYFTGSRSVSTTGYALTSDPIQGHDLEPGWPYLSSLIGDTRVRATAQDTAIPVFVGIAPSVEAARYLAGAEYTTVTGFADGRAGKTTHPGGAVAATPVDAGIWVAQISGSGIQTLTWQVRDGEWTVVVMNDDGSPGVDVRVEAGATVPVLGWMAAGVFAAGVFLLAWGVGLIWFGAYWASRRPVMMTFGPGRGPTEEESHADF